MLKHYACEYMHNHVFSFFLPAVTIGFAQKVFNGTEGSNDPFEICALLMIGSLERFVSIFITTLDTGATATGTTYA